MALSNAERQRRHRARVKERLKQRPAPQEERRAAKVPPSVDQEEDVDPIITARQVAALINAWDKASPRARERFRGLLDTDPEYAPDTL